jgi:signal transduction histidine kinase
VRVLGRDLATAGDPVELERAALDLLAHAVSSTRVGGRVVATLVREGSEVVVAVEDGGAGIDPRTGVGVSPLLGLALVQTVVAAHGGTVDVCSGIGLGTRVVVRLPVRSPPPTA